MKTQSAKAKGRRLQQEVAKLIQTVYSLSSDDVRSTSMGAGGVDILLSKDAKVKFPYSVECKNQEKLKTIYNMWAQTKANAQIETLPLLVIKCNKERPLVVMDLADFLTIDSGNLH